MSHDKIEPRRTFMKTFGKLAGVTIAVAAFVLLFSNDAQATKNANSINSIYSLNGIQFERSTRMNQINSQNVIRQNASLDRLVNGAAVQQYAQANTRQQLAQLKSQLNRAKTQLEFVKERIVDIQQRIAWEKAHSNSQTTIIFLYGDLHRANEQKINLEYQIDVIQDRIQQLIGGGY